MQLQVIHQSDSQPDTPRDSRLVTTILPEARPPTTVITSHSVSPLLMPMPIELLAKPYPVTQGLY